MEEIKVPGFTPPTGTYEVTLELPVGEGPLDIYQAFTAIAQNLLQLANGEPKPVLSEFQSAMLAGALSNAELWSKKLERYG